MTLHISEPEPGWYRAKLTRGAVFVPVLVYRPCPIDPDYGYPLDRWRALRCLVDGEEVSSAELDRLWPYVWPIPESEYVFLVGLHEWARRHAPYLPEANTRTAVDLASMAPVF